MKNLIKYLWIMIFLLPACTPEDPGDTDPGDTADPTHGLIVFEFQTPDIDLPSGKIHRVDLSLARTADSLYRKQFISAANVSDLKQSYSFVLLPGRYFYQAGVSCTAKGDSCNYAGFPGGYLSIWWTMGWVDVDAGKTYSKNIIFQ
jgi:hypothetical protein